MHALEQQHLNAAAEKQQQLNHRSSSTWAQGGPVLGAVQRRQQWVDYMGLDEQRLPRSMAINTASIGMHASCAAVSR